MFSKILSTGGALQSGWSPTALEDFGDTLWYSLETLCPSLLLFPTTDKSLWITSYTCHSYDHPPIDLVSTRYPEVFSIIPRILCAYCLAVPFHLNTSTDNFSHLSSIHSSPVVHVFHNGLWNTIRSFKKSLVAYCSAILVCLHYGCFPYVWQYSLVSLGTVILILLIQHECECTQSSIDPFKLSFRLRRHFKQELVLDKSICRQLYP